MQTLSLALWLRCCLSHWLLSPHCSPSVRTLFYLFLLKFEHFCSHFGLLLLSWGSGSLCFFFCSNSLQTPIGSSTFGPLEISVRFICSKVELPRNLANLIGGILLEIEICFTHSGVELPCNPTNSIEGQILREIEVRFTCLELNSHVIRTIWSGLDIFENRNKVYMLRSRAPMSSNQFDQGSAFELASNIHVVIYFGDWVGFTCSVGELPCNAANLIKAIYFWRSG